ncbi:MAG TPA: hypothetical protein VGP84_02950 [Gemmatimonadaceae bacterium]|nr:hypothetical protein [Gemmatimonadaceae bacterium]
MTRNDARAFVLFATYGAQPGLTEDDQHFARALERRGVQVCAAAWDDPAAAWSSAAAVVIRSTWDYHLRRADFLTWVARVSAATTLYNDARAMRWNSHKSYLAEIARRGVPVIDTVFASVGSNLDLTAVAREHGWRDVVVKPAVSASAHETRRFDVPDRAEGQAHLDRLLATRDVMVQPHLAALAEQGELSLLFARGRFTHAVRRRSALVDGHVMPKSAPADAPAAAIECAARVLEAAGALTGVSPNEMLYSRVDLAATGSDYVLLELELIEPSLFLVHAPNEAEAFAAALVKADPSLRSG